jgi:hypothetical protein
VGLISAFLTRAPNLEQVGYLVGGMGTPAGKSGLHYAMRSPFTRRLVRLMIDHLSSAQDWGDGQLVSIDSTALSLPATRQTNCASMNDATKGKMVLWGVAVDSRGGQCPLKLLHITEGSHHDARAMDSVALKSNGPIHLMDRGFYSLKLLERWTNQHVRFVCRARTSNLIYERLRPSRKKRVGTTHITFDGLARLGSKTRRGPRPIVRLVDFLPPTGERIVLICGGLENYSTSQILGFYRRRWDLETFHNLVKNKLGLAHLYNFQSEGMELLLLVVMLIVALLLKRDPTAEDKTVQLLLKALDIVRSKLGIQRTCWKANTITTRRRKKRRKPTAGEPTNPG